MLLGFRSLDEVFVYVVAVLCGISMLMPINAIFSAPAYILFFYRYTAKDPNAVAHNTNFWANVLTYYNLISLVTSIVVELTTLTPAFARIPVRMRMYAGLIILVVEIALFLIVPAAGAREVGAIATICLGGFISGVGKSVFEATVYGMFGAFPPRYLAAVMGGSGVSGVLTSVLQMIVRGALQDGYEDVRTQSKIYYGLSVGVQGTTFVCLIVMQWSRFAQHHTADFDKKRTDTSSATVKATTPMAAATPAAAAVAATTTPPLRTRADTPTTTAASVGAPVVTVAQAVPKEVKDDAAATPPVPRYDGHRRASHDNGGSCIGSRSSGDNSHTPDDDLVDVDNRPQRELHRHDGGNMYVVQELADAQRLCGSAGLARVDKVHVFRAIWPLFVACALDFGLTLMLYPTLVVYVDPDDYWYGTVIMLIFNVCDAMGRFSPTLSLLRPRTYAQRWLVLAASASRLVFVPLLVLASYHYIPSKAFCYVMTVMAGYTNGYVGAVAMVIAPMSPQLRSDVERFISGTMMGISILIGGAIGTALSILVQSVRV